MIFINLNKNMSFVLSAFEILDLGINILYTTLFLEGSNFCKSPTVAKNGPCAQFRLNVNKFEATLRLYRLVKRYTHE